VVDELKRPPDIWLSHRFAHLGLLLCRITILMRGRLCEYVY
jgi:hypothetical protein